MTIFVGSKNPVKVNAVINAASETWPEVIVHGIDVASGVSDQPRSDEETKMGAINRARAVLEEGLRNTKFQNPNAKFQTNSKAQMSNDKKRADYLGVGLEGGVFINDNDEMWSTVWIAVVDREENLHTANGARFKVPDIVADRIRKGEEMGPIIAQVVGEEDVRSKQGMIGVITAGFVDRTEEYTGIVKMALGLWYGRGWLQNVKAQI